MLGIAQRHGRHGNVEARQRSHLAPEYRPVVGEGSQGGGQIVDRIQALLIGLRQQAQGALCLVVQTFGGDPERHETIEAIEIDDRIALLLGDPQRRFGLAELIQKGRGNDVGGPRRVKLGVAQRDELHRAIGGKSGIGRFGFALNDGEIGLGVKIIEELEKGASAALMLSVLPGLAPLEESRFALEHEGERLVFELGGLELVLGAVESAGASPEPVLAAGQSRRIRHHQ
jgi:hypothetical protein